MKLSFLFIILSFFLLLHVALADSSSCTINTLLKVGSRGLEVQCLQEKMGITADGSFGPLTKAAVINFQSQKGLVSDGIVGAVTRANLNVSLVTMPNNGNYPLGCTSTVGYSATTGARCDGGLSPVPSIPLNDQTLKLSQKSTTNTESTDGKNPNLENSDQFIATVVQVNKEDGKTDAELKLIADTLKSKLMDSSVDYTKQFEELLVSESKLSVNLKTEPVLSFFDRVVEGALSFLGIHPSVAQASLGSPFGGRLLAAVPCIGSWMITIQPLPPTNVVLLSYYPFTQGFASYNIPFTTSLLGFYAPTGVCSYTFVNISTQGTITPIVGSSPF